MPPAGERQTNNLIDLSINSSYSILHREFANAQAARPASHWQRSLGPEPGWPARGPGVAMALSHPANGHPATLTAAPAPGPTAGTRRPPGPAAAAAAVALDWQSQTAAAAPSRPKKPNITESQSRGRQRRPGGNGVPTRIAAAAA